MNSQKKNNISKSLSEIFTFRALICKVSFHVLQDHLKWIHLHSAPRVPKMGEDTTGLQIVKP